MLPRFAAFPVEFRRTSGEETGRRAVPGIRRRTILKEPYLAGAPDLVVEVLSPATAAMDRHERSGFVRDNPVGWNPYKSYRVSFVDWVRCEGA
jgi:hypothetical protein